jgi:amidase
MTTRTTSPGDTSGPLNEWSATTLSAAIHKGDVSAVEVMTTYLDVIDALNPEVNAIVSRLSREECLAQAVAADSRRLRGEPVGVLHGMPVAVKDLSDAAGFRTTLGSRAFADAPPARHDAPFVRRMRAAGAIVIGKTNVAEYGVGALAVNDVFGTTRNPYDLSRHAGGSTGGAAAVAAGMLPLCDGSDSGGSIRYPTAFCNVVGLRTTPGLVAGKGHANSWDPHAVQGPVARDSRDAALLLSAMSGGDAENPSTWGRAPTTPLTDREWGDAPVRLAWSRTLGGLPVAKEILEVMDQTRTRLEGLGFDVVDIDIDLSEGDLAWPIIEKVDLFMWGGQAAFERPELYGAEFLRNIEEGRAFPAATIGYAKHLRYTLYLRMAAALQGFDALVCPATPVAAPPAADQWVRDIEGERLDRYYEWQALASRLVMTAHPVLVTGAGFTAEGLPVGMQLVGPMGSDRRLLALGDHIENLTPWNSLRPVL